MLHWGKFLFKSKLQWPSPTLTIHNTQHMSKLHLQKKIWKGLFSWNISSLCICTIVDVFLPYIVTWKNKNAPSKNIFSRCDNIVDIDIQLSESNKNNNFAWTTKQWHVNWLLTWGGLVGVRYFQLGWFGLRNHVQRVGIFYAVAF